MVTPEALDVFLSEARNVVVAGVASSGRPVMTPNWFHWDGERFYVSTTRDRLKYPMFTRDPRVQLLFDDPTGFRSVIVNGRVEFWEDLDVTLPYFRAIRGKHGRPAVDDETMRSGLEKENRVLLVVVPEKAPADWTAWGF
ncbi:MAG: pyridoxamine 5'-phosphate oxidase family protein [Thermoplasmata archaeon]|nr:pyridoxamine 5'-phosphate oxidase family protein [Thermoplasmata archaeon]